MNIAQLQRLRTGTLPGTDRPGDLPRIQGDAPDKGGFKNVFEEALNQVDGAQKNADTQIDAFVAGEQENLHEVVLSMNQAEVYFQLMTEVRNRMLDTYQELMRMQV